MDILKNIIKHRMSRSFRRNRSNIVARKKKELAFKRRWRDALLAIRGNKHFNEHDESYVINNVTEREFGMTGDIALPLGLSVNGFLQIKDIIEDSMRCLLVLKHNRDKGVLSATIVNKKPDFRYRAYKCEEEFILCGYDNFGEPHFLDLTQSTPHLLITGASGTGKSFICYMIIANLIYSWDKDKNNFDIILLQIMKTELSAFKDCEPCKKYGMYTELFEVAKKLEELEKLAKTRAEVLENSKVRTWNKQNPDKKMKPIFVCIDELAFFMPGPTEKGEVAELKKKCIHHMIKIGQAGRSAGIHIICLCQRGTAKNIEPNMKSNFARLTAFQNSIVDSQAILDCADATKLLDREVILKAGGDMKMLYIPTLKEDCSDLKEYVPEMRMPKPKTKTDIEAIDKLYGDFDIAFNSLGEDIKDDPLLADLDEAFISAVDNDVELSFEKLNGRNVTRLNKVQDTTDHKGFMLSDKDKILLNFINTYGVITTGAANAIRKVKSKAGERLAFIEKAELINSKLLCDLDNEHTVVNEKVFYKDEIENMYHRYLVVYFYGMLYKKGFTIDSFKLDKKILTKNGAITPDATFEISKGGKKYTLYYEANYGYSTDKSTVSKYEEVGGILVIGVKDKNIEIPTSDKITVIKESFKVDLGNMDNL